MDLAGSPAPHGRGGLLFLRCAGVIHYKGAKIQLLDLPGIIEGAKDGKGRGRQVGAPLLPLLGALHRSLCELGPDCCSLRGQVIGTARTCDLICIVLDVTKPFTHKRIIENELEGFGIRLNKEPPDIKIKKKERGGITFNSAGTLTKITGDEIKAICSEYRMSCADISFRCDASAEDLIDAIEGNRVYTKCIYVMNKIDCITISELDIVAELPHQVPISARDKVCPRLVPCALASIRATFLGVTPSADHLGMLSTVEPRRAAGQDV